MYGNFKEFLWLGLPHCTNNVCKTTMARTQSGYFFLETHDERWVVMVRVKEHLQEKTGFTLQNEGFSHFKTNYLVK